MAINPDELLSLENIGLTEEDKQDLLAQFLDITSDVGASVKSAASSEKKPKKPRLSYSPVEESIKCWISIIHRQSEGRCYEGFNPDPDKNPESDHVLFKFKPTAQSKKSLKIVMTALTSRAKNCAGLNGIFNFGQDILVVFKEGLHPIFKKFLANDLDPEKYKLTFFDYKNIQSEIKHRSNKRNFCSVNRRQTGAPPDKLNFLNLFNQYYNEVNEPKAKQTSSINNPYLNPNTQNSRKRTFDKFAISNVLEFIEDPEITATFLDDTDKNFIP